MSIIVNNLSYIHPDRAELFAGISFSVQDGDKASLVGDNGSGKSTLLRILAGELRPSGGEYSVTELVWYVPQHFGQYDDMTVAGALGIEEKLTAMEAITAGNTDEVNYTALADDWTIGDRARAALDSWDLGDIAIDQPMSTLSGGEKTRVFLAGIAVTRPDTILMDEPTNHLDMSGREQLYSLIRRSPATIFVVSHDRALLNTLDTTLEMTRDGIRRYGGNYDFYKAARDIQQDAIKRQIEEKGKELRAAERKAREVAERKERSDSRASKNMADAGIPRIMKKTIMDKAAKTDRKLAEAHSEKISGLTEETRSLRDRLTPESRMRLAFDDAGLHRGKILIDATEINFHYPGAADLWPAPLSFIVRSGERIAIKGGNGSGKTTLLRIMLGESEPTSGSISRSGGSHVYIDQEYSLIDDSLTVLEQLGKFNTRNLPDHFLRTELHRFLFPAETWDKPCRRLSGGEKMKLTLCCLEVANDTPDIFVLDEPTNNLDIRSMEILTSAVSGYRGTVLVISHDTAFLDDIGVTGSINLKI